MEDLSSGAFLGLTKEKQQKTNTAEINCLWSSATRKRQEVLEQERPL